MYSGNYESVFEQQLNAIDGLESAEAFRTWVDAEVSARLTDNFFDVTLPNEFNKNRTSGPAWNGFLTLLIAYIWR